MAASPPGRAVRLQRRHQPHLCRARKASTSRRSMRETLARGRSVKCDALSHVADCRVAFCRRALRRARLNARGGLDRFSTSRQISNWINNLRSTAEARAEASRSAGRPAMPARGLLAGLPNGHQPWPNCASSWRAPRRTLCRHNAARTVKRMDRRCVLEPRDWIEPALDRTRSA